MPKNLLSEKLALTTSGGRGAGGAVLDPRVFPGMVHWFDASRISGVADGATLTDWPELLRGVAKFTQATEANKPLYKLNLFGDKPGVQFDGVDDFMAFAPGTENSDGRFPPVVFVYVARLRSGTGYTLGASADHHNLVRAGNNFRAETSTNAIDNAGLGLAGSDFQAHVFTHVQSPVARQSFFRVDGVEVYSTGAGDPGWNPDANWALGSRGGPGHVTPGAVDIAEVMVFGAGIPGVANVIAVPSAAQLHYLEKSLQYKYWPAFRVRG